MPGIRFSDPQDREDVIALGLPAGRLGLAGAGLGATLEAVHLPIPTALRVGLAGLLLLNTAALVWVRFEGLSLARWTGRAACFGWRRQAGRWVAADRDGANPG